MSASLKETGIKIAFWSAVLGVTAFFTMESSEDKKRKPAAIDVAVKNALATCDQSGQPHFESRLRDILKDTRTKSMDTLRENDITVCLDTRISQQTSGFFDRRIDGIFYSGAIGGDKPGTLKSIVSLWDNGVAVGKEGFMAHDASDYGAEGLNVLAKNIRKHGMPKPGDDKVAGRYSYRCGDDSTCWETRWKSVPNFDQSSIRKNQFLKSPPTKAQW